MLVTAGIVWASGMALVLIFYGLGLCYEIGQRLFRPRSLNRRMARNQYRLSRDRPQIGRRRPLPKPSRNGRRMGTPSLRYSRSLDPRRGLR